MPFSLSVNRVWLIIWSMLIALPATIWLGGYNLFATVELDQVVAQSLYWLTSTGTAPYGVLTVLVVFALCYWRLPRPLMLSAVIAISIAMVSSLSLNQFLKPFFSEPRPNAVLLQQHQLLDTDTFYQLSKVERQQQIALATEQYLQHSNDIALSNKIKQHWVHEVGFAFPSGHTLFAVSLTLVTSYFFILAGQIWLPTLLVIWTWLMGVSRMVLGMHWSQDVLASTFIGGLLAVFSLYLVINYQAKIATISARLFSASTLKGN
ncbi:phosphatase PAP2 family protein [Shewanella waksmanii]|uniref:phosphatase PAP2 family protein n=1 Tax=Shewanella waksmanii TaxID=213783 RepID=UPI003735C770